MLPIDIKGHKVLKEIKALDNSEYRLFFISILFCIFGGVK